MAAVVKTQAVLAVKARVEAVAAHLLDTVSLLNL